MGPATLIPLLERKPPKPAALATITPSRSSVRKQLSTILESHGFPRAHRMQRFLNLLSRKLLRDHQLSYVNTRLGDWCSIGTNHSSPVWILSCGMTRAAFD